VLKNSEGGNSMKRIALLLVAVAAVGGVIASLSLV
jgi:hypothetical protein